MTFSLVARCPRSGQLGIGAITAGSGVGKLVPYLRAGVGAVTSQAMLNPYLGVDGIDRLDGGSSAPDALAELVDADEGRDWRQCAMVDATGRTAGWTGTETLVWSGHREGDGVVVSGNRLVGPETVDVTLEAYEAHPDRELVERLLLALEAGEETGADREGALSGAIVVHDTEAYPCWDLRADHADDPAVELRRLFRVLGRDLVPEVRRLPTRADPLGAATREALEARRSR